MIVYSSIISLTIISDIISQLSNRRYLQKILLILNLLYVTYVASIRVNIGQDYGVWVKYFNLVSLLGYENVNVEIGYGFLNQILINLGFTYRSLFIVESVFIGIVLYLFVTNFVDSCYWSFSIFLYVCSGLYFNAMNLSRQFIAITFGILALFLLKKQCKILSILCIVAASMFHASAFILLLLFPLLYILHSRRRFKWICVIGILSVFLSVVGISELINSVAMMNAHWSIYVESETEQFFVERNESAIFKVIVPLMVLVVGIAQDYLLEKRTLTRRYASMSYSIVVAGTLAYVILQIIGYGIQPVYRMGLYFAPFFIIYTCDIVTRQRKYLKLASWFCLIVYYLLLNYVTIFLWNGSGVMPYQSIFGIDRIM